MKRILFTFSLFVCLVFSLLAQPVAGECLVNGDFETGQVAPWSTTKPVGSLSLLSDSIPAGGNYVLGIDCPEEPRRLTVCQRLKQPLAPGKYRFSGYVDTTRLTIPSGYVMFYVTGEDANKKWKNFGGFNQEGFVKGLGWRKFPWHQMECEFEVKEGDVVKNILVDCVKCCGVIMVDNLSITPVDPKAPKAVAPAVAVKNPVIAMVAGGNHAMYLPGETPVGIITIDNKGGIDQTVAIQFQTVDYFCKTVLTTEKTYTIKAGEVITDKYSFASLEKYGFYCCNANWKTASGKGTVPCSFVKLAALPEKPDRKFGMSVYGSCDAEQYALLGVGTKGYFFEWSQNEDKNGNIDLTRSNRLVNELLAKGVHVTGHFSASLDFGTPKRLLKVQYGSTEDRVADRAVAYREYEKYIEAVVNVFKDRIHEWSLGTEINLTAFIYPHARSTYVETVKLASRAIRRADPTAKVTSLSVSGADGRAHPRYPYVRGLLPELKEYLDGLALDQYTAGQQYGEGCVTMNSEETEFRDIMQTAVKLAKDNGMSIVSIEEKGACIIRTTPIDSPLGTRMGNIVAREYIILKTVPEVTTWLYFRLDNWNPKSVVDYGMWEKTNPRQVVSAYGATARIMANATFVRDNALHVDLPCWIFQKGKQSMAVLWYNGSDPLKFTLPKDARATVLDVQGNPVPLKNGQMILGEAPQYLMTDSAKELDRIIRNASYDIPVLDAVLDTVNGDKTVLALRNLGGTPITLSFPEFATVPAVPTPRELTRELKLAPAETRILSLPYSAEQTKIVLKTSSGEIKTVQSTFRPYRLKRVKGFDELAGMVPILLNDPDRQCPGYADLKSNGNYTSLEDLSAEGRFGYDDQNFYMEVRVKDDIHQNNNRPGRNFAGDCLQYAFDTRRDARTKALRGLTGFTDDDYNLVSALSNGTPTTFCYNAASDNYARLLNQQLAAPVVIRDEKAKTTLYRVRIPFADLAPLKPMKGKVFGFSFLVFDYDGNQHCYFIQAAPGITNPNNLTRFLPFMFE